MRRSVVEVLARLGGAASTAEILRHTTQWQLRAAQRRGEVIRLGRGAFALADADPATKATAAVHGVLSHQSAAAFWQLESISCPASVHVTVPANARPRPRKGVVLHYCDLADDKVTAPLLTVLDCARTLPFHEALAIADSACRRQLVERDQLEAAALRLRGASRQRVLTVVTHADGRAANPFESGLRAIAIEAGIRGFEPQLVIPGPAWASRSGGPVHFRVDLGDPGRRIVFEGDSFAFHGTPEAFARDCHRYNELTCRGWLVLRFTWDDVVLHRDATRRTMLEACRLRQRPPFSHVEVAPPGRTP